MPVHGWSRVFDGAFHDFHHAWIAELWSVLNGGILPADYYAMAEPVTRPIVPDILTLQSTNGIHHDWSSTPVAGATAVATVPPRVHLHESLKEETAYARRQRSVVIR